MNPSAPSKKVWIVAMIIGGLGLSSMLMPLPFVSEYSYWFFVVAFVLMALGTTFKEL